MGHLKLSFLGTFHVVLNGQPLNRFRSVNAQGMLVYLVIQADRPLSRDVLANLFWPDEPDDVARTNFRQTLYQLRKVLQDDQAEKPFLLVTRQTVQFNPAADYALDIDQFVAALTQERFDKAVELYHGELLMGFACDSLEFEAWLRLERERLHQLALEALYELTEKQLDQADYTAAQVSARRQLALEPWLESAFRQLMQALALDGDRSGALSEYENCRQILERELGLDPSADSAALAEHIRSNQIGGDDPNLIDGRYALGEQIGRGAMGVVYRGRDTRTGRLVAIKTVDAQTVKENPTILERFQREGEILRRLRHPNIVNYLAMVEREGQYYLVMEYVGGGDLRQLVYAQQPFALRQVLTIALDVADALARTHRLNILHRDLKPSNILLNENGVPKLSDFGLARFYDDGELTQHGTVVGTVAYLSPEACEGRPLDQRADIWSFGVLLYELLTGQRPFVGVVTSAVLLEIITKPTPDIAAVRPDIPLDLQQILAGMLQKDPAERINSIRHVGAVLETILRADDGLQLSQRFPITQPIRAQDSSVDHYAPTVFNIRLPSTVGALEALSIRTTFVGRVAEMSTIIQTLNRPTCRVLTIVGAGGVGKTRLAVKVAQAFMKQTGQTAHFTSLMGISTVRQVLQSLVTALNVAVDDMSAWDETVMQHVVEALQTRPLLLVFDHVEALLQSDREQFLAFVNSLSEQLPQLRMVVTSRLRLKIQREWVFKVHGLSVPVADAAEIDPQTAAHYDAIALFSQRARQADAAFELTSHNTQIVVQLCQQLEGSPLGIELTAAQLQYKNIQEIYNDLLALHTNLQADLEEVPFHHRSLATVFEQSWQLLSGAERETLAQTAVFRDGFSRAAAFAVLGKQVAHFESLLEHSLLVRHYTPYGLTRVRYTLPRLLRKHLLIAHPPPYEVYRRHADYYLQWAIEHHTSLYGEVDNVTAAWEWSRTQSSFSPPRGWDAAWLSEIKPNTTVKHDELELAKRPLMTTFVGRDQELEALRQMVAQQWGLLTVIGAAGIGKSYLVETVWAEILNTSWFECPCDETSTQGLLPFRHWLMTYFRQQPEEKNAVNLEAFAARFEDLIQATADAPLAAELDHLRSMLAALVDLVLPNSLYTRLRPEQRGENFQQAIRALLKAESLLQPVVIHVEDAHWLDADSRVLLESLLRQTEEFRLTVIITARPSGFEPLKMHGLPEQTWRLTPFDAEAVTQLAAHLLDETPAAELVSLLLEKGAGNPFYTEQILLYLRENGLVKDGKLVSSAASNINTLLPSDVHNVLVSRLGRLDAAVQEVVAQAAVLGQEFSVPVLSQAVGAEQLKESLQAGLEAAVWQSLGNGRYLFNHALLREAAVTTQFEEHKRELHQKAAHAVAKLATAERPHYAELAYHYDEAGDEHRAANHYLKAGDEARENYFIREAHHYYSRGLELAQTTKEQLALLLGREAVNDWSGNREQQNADLRQLVGLTAGSDDKRLLSDITLRRATMYLATAEYDQAIQQAKQATALASSIQDRLLEAKAYHRWGRALWQQGKGQAAEPVLKRALRLAQTTGKAAEQAPPLYDLGMISYYDNRYEEALQHLQQALVLFEQEDDKRNIVRCTDNLGLIAMATGSFEQALTYFEQALLLCRQIAWPYGEVYVLNHLGNCYFELGDYQHCRAFHQDVITLARLVGDQRIEVISRDSIGLTYQFENDFAQAKTHYEQALVLLESLNSPREKAFVQTHLGLTLIGLEEMEQASIYLYDSMTLWIDIGLKELAIDTEAALAWLDLAQGETEFAVERIRQVVQWLQEHGADGLELPLQVYWQCYTILRMVGTAEEAQQVLQDGYALLQKRAQNIQDDALRQQYLGAADYQRQIVAAWEVA